LLSPWFLAGLGAVAVPVWLHLLRQHRGVPRPFASLMFFERRAQSSIKHRRIRYWLLLALRAAVVTLLALAFANPFVRGRAATAERGPKLMVLAVDHSWSMRQGDRLSRARQEAASALSGLGASDRAQVLSFARQARLEGKATQDRAELRAALETVEPGDSRSSYGELARALRSLAESAQSPLEAHLFSDMQKTSLPPSFEDLRLPAGARLVVHPVGAARLPNWTVETVTAPRHLYEARKGRVQASVAGFGTERASRRVSLVVNHRVLETKEVDLPAGGRAAAEFQSLEVAYGWNRCEVRLEAGDAFPDDDRFYFAVERGEPRAVLLVHERRDTRSPLYFRDALEAGGGGAFRLETLASENAGRADPRKYAFVVLSDAGTPPKEFETMLQEYARRGGSVLVALGASGAAAGRVPVAGLKVLETRYAARDRERFQSVAEFDSGHPAAFRGEGVKFYQAVRVEPGAARVLARLSDQTPLLLEARLGEGRVLVFASTFDNLANDFPLHAAWVPFLDRTARYLGRLEEAAGSLTVDAFLDLHSGGGGGAAVEVLDPRGRRALTLAESSARESLALGEQGFYEVHRPDGRQELVAVNADRAESDFETVPAETLALWQNTGTGVSGGSGEAVTKEERVSLWWYVLAALLAVATIESLVGNRYLAGRDRPRAVGEGEA
jgi:hypothetical protein